MIFVIHCRACWLRACVSIVLLGIGTFIFDTIIIDLIQKVQICNDVTIILQVASFVEGSSYEGDILF